MTDQPQFPLYFKATDAEGKIFALLCVENINAITILSKQGARFLLQQVATWEDVRMTIGGQITPAEGDEYNDTLYKDWNFQLSNVVLNCTAQPAAPVLQEGEKVSETEPAEAEEDEGEAGETDQETAA